jgi:hypothetical protein
MTCIDWFIQPTSFIVVSAGSVTLKKPLLLFFSQDARVGLMTHFVRSFPFVVKYN